MLADTWSAAAGGYAFPSPFRPNSRSLPLDICILARKINFHCSRKPLAKWYLHVQAVRGRPTLTRSDISKDKVDAVALTNQTFLLFGPTKQNLGGKHFADDDDVQDEVLLWMRQQPNELYAAGIGAPMKRWDEFINIGGDYVEE
ncbi:hypothetical protein AVEN_69750-1 [Araneus ventricosus]|uniref:Uncharacterized protein n=1 Tax=Araneus ventricosus TaxID=182803 RepID=A0A4Y2CVX2_ARAVE|nr:hypothetical protein AVEN_69750-1 [Araneus ventricosus]